MTPKTESPPESQVDTPTGEGLASTPCSDFLSIPLHDGTRLQLGDCFTVEDCYPFFLDGEENYNARLCWDDEDKTMWYDIYPVSDRVRGCACGGGVGKDEIDWSKIRRRPDPSQNKEIAREERSDESDASASSPTQPLTPPDSGNQQ